MYRHIDNDLISVSFTFHLRCTHLFTFPFFNLITICCSGGSGQRWLRFGCITIGNGRRFAKQQLRKRANRYGRCGKHRWFVRQKNPNDWNENDGAGRWTVAKRWKGWSRGWPMHVSCTIGMVQILYVSWTLSNTLFPRLGMFPISMFITFYWSFW